MFTFDLDIAHLASRHFGNTTQTNYYAAIYQGVNYNNDYRFNYDKFLYIVYGYNETTKNICLHRPAARV